jgi:hypothetical protein
MEVYGTAVVTIQSKVTCKPHTLIVFINETSLLKKALLVSVPNSTFLSHFGGAGLHQKNRL